jgi:hypothetical protein
MDKEKVAVARHAASYTKALKGTVTCASSFPVLDLFQDSQDLKVTSLFLPS